MKDSIIKILFLAFCYCFYLFYYSYLPIFNIFYRSGEINEIKKEF